MQSAHTAGLRNLRKGHAGGRTLRSGVILSAKPGIVAEPLKPAQGFRGPHEGTAGMRPRLGSICRICEESPTSMAMFSKAVRRRLSSRISPRS